MAQSCMTFPSGSQRTMKGSCSFIWYMATSCSVWREGGVTVTTRKPFAT